MICVCLYFKIFYQYLVICVCVMAEGRSSRTVSGWVHLRSSEDKHPVWFSDIYMWMWRNVWFSDSSGVMGSQAPPTSVTTSYRCADTGSCVNQRYLWKLFSRYSSNSKLWQNQVSPERQKVLIIFRRLSCRQSRPLSLQAKANTSSLAAHMLFSMLNINTVQFLLDLSRSILTKES